MSAFSAQSLRASYVPLISEADAAKIDSGYAGADLYTALLQLAHTKTKDEIKITVTPISGDTGPASRKTLVLAAMDDRPFIVDSFAAELARHGITIDFLTYPCLNVTRNAKGEIQSIGTQGGQDEVFIVILVNGALTDAQCKMIREDLLSVAEDVQLVTRDWRSMLARVRETIVDLEQAKIPESEATRQEYIDFLRYVYDNNFTLIGMRSYTLAADDDGNVTSTIIAKDNLGILSDQRKPIFLNKSQQSLPQDLQRLRLTTPTLSVYKVNRKSTVHRRVPLDAISIKIYDDKGKVVGERMFLGLFTSVTYSRSVNDIPLLRKKVHDVVESAKFAENSHDYRALLHILEKYPRDELFQLEAPKLKEFALSILTLQERQRVALYTRVDPFRRYVSALVYVPRDRYETQLRVHMQEILEQELHGTCNAFYTVLDDSPLARVSFIIDTDQNNKHDYNFKEIEAKLVEAARSWADKLRSGLLEHHAAERSAAHLAIAYEDAFPVDYQLRYTGLTAAQDIDFIEAVLETKKLVLNLYRPSDLAPNQARLKVYTLEKQLGLSDILPTLENMGVRVEGELNFETKPHEGLRPVWIQDFLLTLPKGAENQNLLATKPLFEEALLATFEKTIESDPLNSLVLQAGVTAFDVVILRTIVKYLVQTKFPFSALYMMRALTDAPVIAGKLIELFHARFNPKTYSDDVQKTLTTSIVEALNNITSLDQDRILRAVLAFIQVSLRTNFYQTDASGNRKPWVSIKIDSQTMPDLPDPRPWREIFVYSPRMEGIHLRGGKVARGGIRWSDRPEDFRTEILGLMQAQMVKNAVIVPVGAKGGFILKNIPTTGGREALMKEGIACYQTLVRGMLDITDNLNGNDVVPPPNVVRYDGDDPYIVAAADKGTATFSDIANGLSAEYNFWLGDAFASGGSAGYDHKVMGITAKGAWESVKRHFRELGTNIQTTDFTVIGVGDMGGDVFGNGMLLSEHIRLIGAFNHVHIFCDPNADPKTSFAERARLFKEVKGWDAYDTSLLSKGGRIYNRSEKSIELTPEIKAAFGLNEDTVAPAVLMKAMLKTPCDLLWFGGIGTFIKASTQTHEDAGDKANDALRVDAAEINAKVIGEGANLGITRKARVELGLRGIKLNADFIDNSGGVDCSDHEVNIKILLTFILQQNPKAMTLAERNTLLSSMTQDVSEHVLRTNYQSAQAISMAELTASKDLQKHARLIDVLERDYGIKRKVEGLPMLEEIEERLRLNQGLTRPELGILLSHAKLMVRQGILASDLPNDPQSQPWLINYFPEALREKFAGQIPQHRLSREIIATQMAASIVNRMGPSFITEMMDKTGASIADIAKICFVVREAFNLRALWHDLEALDGSVPAMAQLEGMRQIVKFMDYITIWVTKRGGDALQTSLEDIMGRFKAGVRHLNTHLNKTLPQVRIDRLKLQTEELVGMGLPEDMARRLAILGPMRSAGDIIRLAHETQQDISSVARLFFHLGDDLRFDWLRHQARLLSGASHWQAQATEGMITQLYATQSVLVRTILEGLDPKTDPIERLHTWEENQRQPLNRYELMLAEMRRVPQLDLAMITLAEQRLRQLAG